MATHEIDQPDLVDGPDLLAWPRHVRSRRFRILYRSIVESSSAKANVASIPSVTSK